MSDEHNGNDENTNPRAIDTAGSLERNLVQSVSVIGPSLAETDVGHADGSPSEEGSKTGQGNEPVKDRCTSGSQVHVAESTPCKDENDGEQRTSRAVHVGEDLGGITLISESGKGTRSTVDTRDTDGDDGDENDNVHVRVESIEASILARNDER